MKIIKHGNIEMGPKTFVCETCGCKFEAVVGEYKTMFAESLDKRMRYVCCKCPDCGDNVIADYSEKRKRGK